MTASELLTTLCNSGLSVRADGDSLIVQPRGLLTDELRAAIRTNKPVILAELGAAAKDDERQTDFNLVRRRAKALALLDEHPNWHRVALAEAGDPVFVGIAIRGIGYGEVAIPACTYDAAELLELLSAYGGAHVDNAGAASPTSNSAATPDTECG